MATHSYSKCLLHIIWGTKNRKPVLDDEVRIKLSSYLDDYAREKQIYMHINYVNADHVHLLIDLPTSQSIQQVVKLFKGSSSHWINKNRLTMEKFSWGRGYGAFSVSASVIQKVKSYIRNQEKHHRAKSFTEELDSFLKAYGVEKGNR